MRVLLFILAAIVATAVGGLGLILYGETSAPLDARPENPLLMAPTSFAEASDATPGASPVVSSCARPVEPASGPFGIRPDPSTLKVTLTALSPSNVELTITNQGTDPVTFVSPLDGSTHGLVEPAYELEAYDGTGRRIPMKPRTQAFYANVYSRTTQTIGPSQAFRAQVSLLELDRAPVRLVLHYSFYSTRVGAKRAIFGKLSVDHSPRMADKLATMFNGRLSSPMLQMPSAAP